MDKGLIEWLHYAAKTTRWDADAALFKEAADEIERLQTERVILNACSNTAAVLEMHSRIAALEAENAELAQFVLDCGGFWGHSRSQLKGEHSLLSVIQSAFEHAERLEWFIDWYLRDGKRAEIDPQGHIRATTREIIFAGIDAARATSSVPETSPPSRQGEDPEA